MNRTCFDGGRPLARAPLRTGAAELRLVVLLGIFVVIGIPFVAILWETLNGLLAGHLEPRRLLISVPLLAVFVVILTFAGRALGRYDRSA